mmetsp:Transcript_9708/g.58894  ORF Transcript_9708/g.58894 Transcript_9708/m.58894 type:complete len:203 (-) Transcript_9708:1052-1660(-)
MRGSFAMSGRVGPARISFVTGNANKVKEVTQILKSDQDSLPFELEPYALHLPEYQGESREIAVEKCRFAARHVGGPVVVEDTSLGFDAMKGLPGPYIKWFLEKLGHDGLNRMLEGFDDTSARATCIFSFCVGPDVEPELFVGETLGTVVPARGPTDFGWDPIFQPEGFSQTYAEMDKATKNSISHRYKALAKLKRRLLQHYG